jgi:hypothetical protein
MVAVVVTWLLVVLSLVESCEIWELFIGPIARQRETDRKADNRYWLFFGRSQDGTSRFVL